jgi:hypothetical protein
VTSVYLAGPYSKGDKEHNVRQAILFGEYLTQKGFIVYVPHLSHFWDLQHPHDHKFWMEYDKHWLGLCDCLLRIPGESAGADIEMKWALDACMPVFLDIDSMLEYYGGTGATAPADE